MARITVEDCLNKVNNRFALVHLASKRVRQLRKGDEPTIVCKNKDIVISLREIAAGNIIKAETAINSAIIDDIMKVLPGDTSPKDAPGAAGEENTRGAEA